MRYVTLRTVAMGVGEALVAAVHTVVYSVADVGRVDALAARQTVKRAVARRTRGAGHRRTAASVVDAAAASTTTAAWTHRVRKVGAVSPAVVSYRRQAFSAAGSVSADTRTHETIEIADSLRDAGNKPTNDVTYDPISG